MQTYKLSKEFGTDEVSVVEIDVSSDFVKFKCEFGVIEVSKYNSRFIHDFTINHELNQSDYNLDNFTPDMVTDQEIIEYTTTEITNHNIMNDRLLEKFLKYKNLAEKHNKDLIVYVVSTNSIISNKPFINENEALNMIKRFNVALTLKSEVFKRFNLDLWISENKQKFERILKSVLSNHKPISLNDEFEKTLDVDLPVVDQPLIKNFIKTCFDEMKSFKTDNVNHCLDYTCSGTRENMKRVIPVSLVIPVSEDCRFSQRVDLINPDLSSMGKLEDHQFKLLEFANSSIKIKHDKDFEMKVAMEEEKVPEKRQKSMYRFEVNLTNDDRVKMAMFGVQAKKLVKSKNPMILEKRAKDKESFNFETSTADIENFINTDLLSEFEGYKSRSIALEMFSDWSSNLLTLRDIDHGKTGINEAKIRNEFDKIHKTSLIQYCKFIQALFTEINLSVRENLDEDVFIVKPIPGYYCDVYIKVIGSMKPIFFFIVADVDVVIPNMTVGVKYTCVGEDKKVIISEWSSVKLRDVENYLSITSKIVSTVAYLKQLFFDNKIISQHVNFILLLLLSNKDRDEEIVTLLRYVYMRAASFTDNVTTLTSKLPTCIRSRLNLYQVKRTLKVMNQLHFNKPKVKMTDNNDRDLVGLYDLFDNKVNFKQALNLCYYGYVVNKSKQTETNQSSKLIDKILEYDLMVNDGKKLAGVNPDELQDHYHNKDILSVVCHLAEMRIIQTYGINYKNHFNMDFINYMSKQNLISLSTIKASAKQDLPETIENNSLSKLKKRRPKVTESLKKIIDDYGSFEHPIELVNYCIYKLDKDDSFNVELFSKDQHAGIREIYVVDIKVRIIQWFLESISRSLCKLFDSETMTNPNMKEFISQKIIREHMLKIDDPVMLCRSGDASKWSQTQNVTKFYQVLKRFLPVEYHSIIKSILALWFRKKIFLPVSLIEACLTTESTVNNETIKFIKEIYSGKKQDKRLVSGKPYLRIQTGFMQGILHFTSSFFHTIIQEGFLSFKTLLVRILFPETIKEKNKFINVILQGSDDNSESLIIPKKIYDKSRDFFKVLVQLKDIMSKYVGIKVSKEKTASCVPFLMEYNSTWELAGKFVMPTIKFVFVSTDIPQKQTLVGRQEFYYSLLTNCLEKGCTLKTCSIIRLAQAEQHYLQLGFLHNLLFEDYIKLLKISKSPALGYFMFEPTVLCCLIGFDFMLYLHSIETSFMFHIQQEEKEIPVQILNNLGYKSIADYTVSKFQFKRYDEIMSNLKLGSVETSREKINERPEILYTVINNQSLELDLINLKMHDFSVKESLSSRFSKSEMFASLVYILSRPVCYFQKKKTSLIKLSHDLTQMTSDDVLSRSKIKRSFIRSKQYDEIIEDIKPIMKSNYLVDQTYVQRGSSKIQILEGLNQESYKLLDLCKAKWFKIKSLPIEEFILNKYFRAAQLVIPWLKETEQETREFLNCDSFQLYYYLMNSFKDSKHIKLLDTPGKKGNLKFLITRIADLDKKLKYVNPPERTSDDEVENIRCSLKFICDYPYSMDYKRQKLKVLLSDYIKQDLKFNEKQYAEMILNVLNQDFDNFLTNLIRNFEGINLVIFTKPQNFNTVKGCWEGDGIILAKSGNLIYELKVLDERVIKIAVNRLDVARKNLQSILKTISELRFILDRGENRHLRLNAGGIQIDKIGTELIEEPSLSFNIANLRNLDINIEHNRIKLVTRMRVGDLNEKTLMDELEEEDMAQVDHEGKLIWVPKHKLGKGTTVKKTCKMLSKEATLIVTICSLKSNRYYFNPDRKPKFEIDDIAEIFWKQEQSVSNFINSINDILVKHEIKNINDFYNKFNLDFKSQKLFKGHLLGDVNSRDDLIQKTIEEEKEVNASELDFDKIFEDLFEKPMSVDLGNMINDELLKTLSIMDDDFCDSLEEDESITTFVKSLTESNKSFYLQFASNDVLENKLFESFYLRLKIYEFDVHLIFEDNYDCDSLPNSIKNVIATIFGAKTNLTTINSKSVEEIKVDFSDFSKVVIDIENLEILINMDEVTKSEYLKEYINSEDNIDFLVDLIKDTNEEIKFLSERYKSQRSIPMKNITSSKIETQNKLKNLANQLLNELNNFKSSVERDKRAELLKVAESVRLSIEEKKARDKKDEDSSDDDDDMSEDDIEKEIIYANDMTQMTFETLQSSGLLPETNLKFVKINAAPFGDCLYISMMNCLISKNVNVAEVYYHGFKENIVNIIKKYEYLDLLITSADDVNYPDTLLKNNEWGDNNCIWAAGLLTRSLFYIRTNGCWTHLLGCPIDKALRTMYLEYNGVNHFDSLILEENLEYYKENLGEIVNSVDDFKF